MSQPPDVPAEVHHLKVTLRDFRPAVWRRLQVPSGVTLGELSDILQDAFEWDGDHLHRFDVGSVGYGPDMLCERQIFDFGPAMVHEDTVSLRQVAPRPGAAFDFTYDLGDEWLHRIEVEDVAPAEPDTLYPACVAGRGLAPEEDSYDYTPGTFTDADRLALNSLFRRNGAVAGRDLPSGTGDVDPVFAALFPRLVQLEAEEERSLAPREPASAEQLADQAAASPLLRRALALARWVDTGRALTPSKLPRPVDAVQAAAELGLAEPLLPAMAQVALASGESAFGDWVLRRRAREAARTDGKPKKVRSAKDLPALHGLWCAAVEAGLIEIRGSKAVIGAAVRAWEDGSAEQRLEIWARLLAGLLRARLEAERADRGYFGRMAPQEDVFPLTAQILDGLAGRPVPALFPALAIAAATGEVMGMYGCTDSLFAAVHAVMSDWTLAGVVERTSRDPGHDAFEPVLKELAATFYQQSSHDGDDDPSSGPGLSDEQLMQAILRPALTAVRDSAAVRLTPLGSYGIRRLLTAHGWQTATS
ncbi:plasmid pRiA4b ORF-3 family protein [Sphaerimonospora cavernae]|uniref:Plasmid pRiA4b ORF-3 family protein n=1 Tax=Sphaerimonospora cavernae TaxID=1740611 RepID=A0ABV6U560_9ACTN